VQVVLAPDPDLGEHLLVHGVMVSQSSSEGNRLQRAFLIQVGTCVLLKYYLNSVNSTTLRHFSKAQLLGLCLGLSAL
jgi:hypothetical protein